jgi:hypothetical protein
MENTIAVADAYGQHLQNVVAMAAASFDRSLAEYRRLVAAMGEHGGALPPEQAAQLIAVCETLGIPPEQLGDDAATVCNVVRLQGMIDEVQKRNIAKREPLPALEADFQAAKDEWLKVSTECQERMRVAQEDLRVKRQAYEKVLMKADESATGFETELIKTRDKRPHLFGPVSREALARLVDTFRRRAAV